MGGKTGDVGFGSAAFHTTLSRMEPDVAIIDAGCAAASIAISLKRIADAMERQNDLDNERLAILKTYGVQGA